MNDVLICVASQELRQDRLHSGKNRSALVSTAAVVFSLLVVPNVTASTTLHGQRLLPPVDSFFATDRAPVVNGDWIAVHGGGPGANNAVFIYRRESGFWAYAQTLLEPPPVKGIPNRFGNTLAICAQALFVGDPQYYNPDADAYTGALFVYTLQEGSWQLVQTIYRHIGSGTLFPNALAVDASTFYIGVPDATSPDYGQTGAVEAYDISAIPGSFVSEILPVPPAGATGAANFGSSIAANAATLVIGAPDENFDGVGAIVGAAYTFSRSGNSWTQQSVLVSPTPHEDAAFSHAVAIDGNRVIAAAAIDYDTYTGIAYSYVPAGSALEYEGALLPEVSAAYDRFGQTMVSAGGLVLVGAPNDGIGGSFYGFLYTESGWRVVGTFITDSQAAGQFGFQVAIDRSTLVVAANEGDWPYLPLGALYVFDGFPTDFIFVDGLDR